MGGIFHKIKRNVLWRMFSYLPKEPRKAVLQSFYGRGYSDSPKAIGEELLRRGGWLVYWVVKGEEEAKTLPSQVIPLRLDSCGAIYHLCTAGVWVDSARKWAYTRKRGNQFYVQTWHGFPLKRIEKDAGDALPPDYIQAAQQDSAMCDLFLSNSAFLTKIYREGFWYQGEILEQGFPRNDMLIHPPAGIDQKVRKALELPEERRLLLYAPTFRKDMTLSSYDVDYEALVKALGKRFGGDWLVLAKLHPNIADKAKELELNPQFVINASAYPDIQELYVACDALLSDYSSVMFDFLCTGKPCFLYVNDLQAYQNDRNFYFDLQKLPYPLAQDNQALEQAVLTFDETTHQARMEAFRREFQICETGKAAAAVCDLLEERMK